MKIWTSEDYKLVLAPRTKLSPGSQISGALRAELGIALDDFALTRPRSRNRVKVVNAEVGAFLHAFTAPISIARAVRAYARVTKTDPSTLLDWAFPVINDMLESGYLMPEEEAALASRTRASSRLQIGPYKILRELQRMDDVSVYCARDRKGRLFALKFAAPDNHNVTAALELEAAALNKLDGRYAPRFAAYGMDRGRPYVAMEWIPGITADRAAESIRSEVDGEAWPRLIQLAAQIAGAYASLHEAGTLHGDIHARNILVTGDQVRLIDFGHAVVSGQPQRERGGVDFFFDPECAAAILVGAPSPPATALGEQYALAVLLYRILTGAWYLPFSAERAHALGQIANDTPLSFEAVGAARSDAIERILLRALSKRPEDRFESTRAFADALEAHAARSAGGNRLARTREAKLEQFVATEVERMLIAGSNFLVEQPLAMAVNMGLAGIAYGAYRLAVNLRSPDLLALADEIALRAAAMDGDDDALYSDHLGLTAELVPRQSAFNATPGVHVVSLLIAHARGDAGGVKLSLREFLGRSAGIEHCGLDYTFGQAGTLTTCANLYPIVAAHAEGELPALRKFGDAIETAMLRELRLLPGERGEPSITGKTGVAHGLAGYLFAVSQWRDQTGSSVPAEATVLLERLADCAVPVGRGISWAYQMPFVRPEFHGGWCNGAAGFVQMWLSAYRAYGEPRWLEIAERAAWTVWDTKEGTWDLCCGRAGRAYALLEMGQVAGDDRWRARGTDFAARAVAEMRRFPAPYVGLFRGAIGVTVLASDVLVSEPRSMPFFGSEP